MDSFSRLGTTKPSIAAWNPCKLERYAPPWVIVCDLKIIVHVFRLFLLLLWRRYPGTVYLGLVMRGHSSSKASRCMLPITMTMCNWPRLAALY